MTSAGDAEWSYILPLKRDSNCDSVHNWTARSGLPFARNRRPGYLELGGRRSVVSTQSHYGRSCGFTCGNAVGLGLAVRYCRQGTGELRVKGRRTGWKIGAKNAIRSLDGCGVSRSTCRCSDRSEIGMILARDGVHGFEYRELYDRCSSSLGEWVLLVGDRCVYRDRVPVQYDIGSCEGRPEP